ncbi:GNAT family N-acetyltransferase [Amycolatopsis anabasis]|uniref:GNAT family N-acetyltransferase n=1 Tax=Amycolatopsis anabasis TaxID=1840409 RepID=UPI00131CE3D6|nr:GNAT family N-acetyltransferase [Amycolatopsis anabasis]
MRTPTIAPLPIDHADARAVLRDYFDDVASRYYGRPATEREIDTALAEDPSDDLVPPTGVFLAARHAGRIVGCVGLRLVAPELAELTRMFVRADARGRGGGSRLLDAAEAAARELGVARIRLDTRDDLVEARALYAKHGYAEVEPFNDDKYAEHWFQKELI